MILLDLDGQRYRLNVGLVSFPVNLESREDEPGDGSDEDAASELVDLDRCADQSFVEGSGANVNVDLIPSGQKLVNEFAREAARQSPQADESVPKF